VKPFLPIVEIAAGPIGVEAALKAVHELFESEISCALVPAGTHSAKTAVRAELPLYSEEPALVLVTSGSMGEPKAVELPLSALAASAEAAAIEFGAPTTWLTALPVTGIGGLNTLVRTALTGSAPVIWDGVGGAESFSAETFTPFVRALRHSADKQKLAAAVSLVPTQIERLRTDLKALEALSQLDFVLVGGAALSSAAIDQLHTVRVNLIRTYGATETSGGVVWNHNPIGDTQIFISPENEIQIAGSCLASFYRDGSAIAPRWATGDLGNWNGQTLEITGRIDRVIKSNGKKVSLDAITKIANEIVGVNQAYAIAMPDTQAGHLPVIAYEGTIEESILLEILNEKLSTVGKIQASRVAAMPMLPNGKPDAAAITAICQTPRP
jgi:O-succinylbenzoic acid--CoA ligase